MINFARDLLTHIRAIYPSSTIDYSLNYIDPAKSDVIAVYDTGGYSADRYHGDALPIDRPTAQVRIRHHSAATARDIALYLFQRLDGLYSLQIDEREYLQITCASAPTYIGTGQDMTHGRAHEYTLNLYSMIKRG